MRFKGTWKDSAEDTGREKNCTQFISKGTHDSSKSQTDNWTYAAHNAIKAPSVCISHVLITKMPRFGDNDTTTDGTSLRQTQEENLMDQSLLASIEDLSCTFLGRTIIFSIQRVENNTCFPRNSCRTDECALPLSNQRYTTCRPPRDRFPLPVVVTSQ